MQTITQVSPLHLQRLLGPGRGERVSIYMPVHPQAADGAQDIIRLKNLIRSAKETLLDLGWSRRDADMLLQEATDLLEDGLFWRQGGDGIALFASLQEGLVFRLPYAFEEFVSVGQTFHIKPLLPLLADDLRFSLLALSLSHVRLLQGDRWTVRDVTPPDIPTSLAEAQQHLVLEKASLVHSAGPPRGGGVQRSAQYHGHGATERDDKTRILEFFRLVDAGIRNRLYAHAAPLVLAGVDHLRHAFRDVCSYRNLMDEGVEGSPDGQPLAALHSSALRIMESRVDEIRDEAAQRVEDRLGTGLASAELREILAAAHFGRVDTLFIARDEHVWGRFDPLSGEMETASEPSPGLEDLLDRAAIDSLSRRGRVFAVASGDVPGGSSAAALFRY
ncbi:MAG: hypothetical protein Kow0056_13510 [Coriobacteriia bacterium]